MDPKRFVFLAESGSTPGWPGLTPCRSKSARRGQGAVGALEAADRARCPCARRGRCGHEHRPGVPEWPAAWGGLPQPARPCSWPSSSRCSSRPCSSDRMPSWSWTTWPRMVTRRHVGPCTTTAPGCAQAWPRRRSGLGPSWRCAASRSSSIGAACAGLGCPAARTCTNVTPCTSPATILALSCPSWSAPARPGSSWPEPRLTSWLLMAPDGVLTGILFVATNTEAAVLAISFMPEPHG